MIIILDKPLKIRLLKAIQAGKYDPDLFPELNVLIPDRRLTKEEARELWKDMDNGIFNIPKNQ